MPSFGAQIFPVAPRFDAETLTRMKSKSDGFGGRSIVIEWRVVSTIVCATHHALGAATLWGRTFPAAGDDPSSNAPVAVPVPGWLNVVPLVNEVAAVP